MMLLTMRLRIYIPPAATMKYRGWAAETARSPAAASGPVKGPDKRFGLGSGPGGCCACRAFDHALVGRQRAHPGRAVAALAGLGARCRPLLVPPLACLHASGIESRHRP